MTAIKKLLAGLLLLSGFSPAALADDSQTTTYQTPVTKTDFVSKTKDGGYQEGDMFLIKIDDEFFPETYGAYYGLNGGMTKVDATFFNGTGGYNAYKALTGNSNKTQAEYVFEKSVGQVVKLAPATATSLDGKVYAYNGSLSRFLYVQRTSKTYTSDVDYDVVQYNPYKKRSANYSSLIPSNDYAFMELSIQAKVVDKDCTNDGTKSWETAYSGDKSMIKDLRVFSHGNNTISDAKSYHYKSITATASYTGATNATYDESKWTVEWTVELNDGHKDDGSCCNGSDGNFTEKQSFSKRINGSRRTKDFEYQYEKLYKLYTNEVDEVNYGTFHISHDCINATMRSHYMHMNAQTGVTDIYNGSTRVQSQFSADQVATTTGEVFMLFVPTMPSNPFSNLNTFETAYRPYIQLFKGVIWYKESHAPDETIGLNSTDYWQHDIKWVDTAMDKFLLSGESYVVERRVLGTSTWEVVPETYYVHSNNNKRSAMQLICDRANDDYWYEYRVKCVIDDTGAFVYTDPIKLPVPGKSAQLNDLTFTITPYSTAVNDGNTEHGMGVNNITHTLHITATNTILTAVQAGQGTFTITHTSYKSANPVTTTVTLTELNTNVPYTYSGSDGKTYKFNEDGTLDYVQDGITYYYNEDGSKKDLYKIAFDSGISNKETNAQYADYYRTDFSVGEANNQDYGNGNYFYADKITWVKTPENINRYFANSYANNTYSFAGDVLKNAETSAADVSIITGKSSTSTTVTNVYVGYIEFPATGDYRYGTWGIGYGQVTHTAGQVSGSKLNSTSVPHNRVLTVQQYKVHDQANNGKTNPTWNRPIASLSQNETTETPQIFPGSDIDFTIDRIPTGKDQSDVFEAAYAVVIYKIVGNEVTRVTPEGTEYFTAVAKDEEGKMIGKTANQVFIPQFNSTQNLKPGNVTKNILYNFDKEEGADYRYDAFVFYIPAGSGIPTSYAHSGYEKAVANVEVGSLAYVQDLPKVAHEPVIHPKKQKFTAQDIKADYLHAGGFSYLVVDMTNAIPDAEEEMPTKSVKESRSEVEYFNNAVTSYKITVKQGNENRAVFTPIVTDTFDGTDMKTTTPFSKVSLNVNRSDELYVYPEFDYIATGDDDEELTYDVKEFTQEAKTSTNQTMTIESSDKYVLLGISGIRFTDEVVEEDPTDEQPQDAPRKGQDKALDTSLTISVEPLYPIAEPKYPVTNLLEGANYPIAYKSDNVSTATRNEIPVNEINLDNENSMDYSVESTGETTLNESTDYNYDPSSIISGAEIVGCDESKVYAEGLTIVVEGEAELVVVFDASAKQVYAGTEHRIEVSQPGVYVVATGGKIYKVFVK